MSKLDLFSFCVLNKCLYSIVSKKDLYFEFDMTNLKLIFFERN